MSVFKQFLISIYQFDKYVELISLKWKKVIFYEVIFFLVTVFISFFPIIVVLVGYGGMEGIINELVPEFKIENGILQAENMIVDENGIRIIVDSNNDRTDFDLRDSSNGVIFDREKIIVNNGIKTQTVSYKKLLEALGLDKFEKSDIFNYISAINMLFITFILLSFIALAVSEIIGILLLSFFTLIINMILKKNLSYPNTIKISVYARSMAVFLTIIFAFFGFMLDFIFVIALNCAYAFFAVKNMKIEEIV